MQISNDSSFTVELTSSLSFVLAMQSPLSEVCAAFHAFNDRLLRAIKILCSASVAIFDLVLLKQLETKVIFTHKQARLLVSVEWNLWLHHEGPLLVRINQSVSHACQARGVRAHIIVSLLWPVSPQDEL